MKTATHPDYATGRCCAITRAGLRCSGRWSTYVGCIFAANATTGDVTAGPGVVLCQRHRGFVHGAPIKAGARIKIVRGWLGAANKYGYGTAVFARRSGWGAARWWWNNRMELKSGECRKDCP